MLTGVRPEGLTGAEAAVASADQRTGGRLTWPRVPGPCARGSGTGPAVTAAERCASFATRRPRRRPLASPPARRATGNDDRGRGVRPHARRRPRLTRRLGRHHASGNRARSFAAEPCRPRARRRPRHPPSSRRARVSVSSRVHAAERCRPCASRTPRRRVWRRSYERPHGAGPHTAGGAGGPSVVRRPSRQREALLAVSPAHRSCPRRERA